MTWQDCVNACYELGGSIATCFSIMVLLRDRVVKGIHWFPTVFFFTWGIWNIYYYYHMTQPISQIGGGALAVANAVWLFLAWRFGAFKRTK
jgi:hypothetical protein